MIQLRPPADADNYRVQTGRFGDRFYTDPLPADLVWPATSDNDVYPAVSTVKKATGQDWSKAMAKRLAKAPSQLVEIAKLESEFERKERLKLLSDVGLGSASNRGTIVHAHAEAMLTNRVPIYQLEDDVKPYIRTLDAFLAAYQPRLVAAEFVAIHRSLNQHNLGRGNRYHGYGGTGDAVVELDGVDGWWLIDWKSRAIDSQHKAYAEEGAQVSAYGRADYWIVGDDTSPHGAKRIRVPELAGGLIVSIKPDSYECYPIDLDEGFDYWRDLHAWWQARRSETRAIGRKWAPRVAPIPGDSETGPDLAASVAAGEDAEATTKESNRARFDALPDIKKGWAREAFKRKGLNPNNPATAGEVSRILGEIEQRPTLREMQEQRAEQIAEHAEPTLGELMTAAEAALGVPPDPLDAEGGEATDEMIAEARMLFDMVIGAEGREWTGRRVQEANEAGVSIQVSRLRSMKRAHIYLALTRWAAWRQSTSTLTLSADEQEQNIEFTVTLNMVAPDTADLPLGHRLALLDTESAEMFASLITEIVESETGEQLATETETQPASEPKE